MPAAKKSERRAHLILIRHGRSEWNEKGLWTGLADPSLSKDGIKEAQNTAKKIKDLSFDFAYTSNLKRAQQTLDVILKTLKRKVKVVKDAALNERDYGDYTGKNKWQIKQLVGEEMFNKIRRSWDYPLHNGESLKMVYERVVPFFKKEMLPKIKEGKNILVAAHGNSLRALVKHLEGISDSNISSLEIPTGEALIYTFDSKGKVLKKEIRAENKIKV